MAKVIELTPELCKSVTRQKGVVLLYFRADWCGACRTMTEGYFSEKALRKVWNSHLDQREEAGYLLWGILNLALFLNGE